MPFAPAPGAAPASRSWQDGGSQAELGDQKTLTGPVHESNKPNPYYPQKLAMPEISRFFGIIVAMYYNEHNPPHFHVRYGDYKAEIDIRRLCVLAGKLPPRALGLVIEWATQHQDDLMEDWELARQDAELKAIAPLE